MEKDWEDTNNTDLGSLLGCLSQTLLLSFTTSKIGPACSSVWRLRGDGPGVYEQWWLHVSFLVRHPILLMGPSWRPSGSHLVLGLSSETPDNSLPGLGFPIHMVSTGPPSLAAVTLLFHDTGIRLQKILAQCLTVGKCANTTLPIPSERHFLAQHNCHIVEMKGSGYWWTC